MKFYSTRNPNYKVTASQAIIQGLAPDGGLFVPESLPKFDWKEYLDKSYQELALAILQLYLTDFPKEDLIEVIGNYAKAFDKDLITPVTSFENFSFLELFHGPTQSFKDLALSLLPGLLSKAYKINKVDKTALVLVATSGDTGSAALHGFQNQKGCQIMVLYPKDGVSEIQMKQMETVDASNSLVLAIDGNFDHGQAKVKSLFNDPDFHKLCQDHQINLTTANSINIGRLIPQIVYYFFAYLQLVRSQTIEMGQVIDISVPTGNFGDILAGIYAKEMGLPIDLVICASNENRVLTDFFQTGLYQAKRPFTVSLSPSMDILVSSNLERYLYHISNHDSQLIQDLYQNLSNQGQFTWPLTFPAYLKAASIDDNHTLQYIEEVFNTYKYLIDPHTAVAYGASQLAQNHCLILSTASPYKFPHAIQEALEIEKEKTETLSQQIKSIEQLSKAEIPHKIKDLAQIEVQVGSGLRIADIDSRIYDFIKGGKNHD